MKALIYQCFYFAVSAQNGIFGSLMLRLAHNSDKLRFNAWFILFKHEMKIFVDNIPTFVYIYFHEGGFISAIAHQ